MAKDGTNPLTRDSVVCIVAKIKPYIDAGQLQQIDQDLLLQEIRWCARNYSVRMDGGGIRLKEKNLKQVSRLKKLLVDLRNDPSTPWRLLDEETTKALTSDRLIRNLDSILACGPTPRSRANPIELLVGQDLAFVFKRLFGLPAGRSRARDQTLRPGPYLAFARAMLDENGHQLWRRIHQPSVDRPRPQAAALTRVVGRFRTLFSKPPNDSSVRSRDKP